MTTYSELLKDPIKNREQLLAMDRAITSYNPRCRQGGYYAGLTVPTRIRVKGKKYARPFTIIESQLIGLEDSPWITGKRQAFFHYTRKLRNPL